MTQQTKPHYREPQYREHYFPNTEELGADEMRVTALGTGRPFLRPAQANAGWLVELGNGDKFMFDFGFGTQTNFAALEIPYERMTAYFATHLHTDHVGDFAQIWIGSWSAGARCRWRCTAPRATSRNSVSRISSRSSASPTPGTPKPAAAPPTC